LPSFENVFCLGLVHFQENMLARHAGQSYAERRAAIVLRRRGLYCGPDAFEEDAMTLQMYPKKPFFVVVIERCSSVLV